jgi:uncharacterized peroxidase-related enzyme
VTDGGAARLARQFEAPDEDHSTPARSIAMHVTPVAPEKATGTIRDLYEDDLASKGYIPNYTRLFSLRPEAYRAWRQLVAAITGPMELRRYELATLAAAEALRCRYCVAAHGAILESKFYDRLQLEAIARDFRNAGLDPLDVAIMAFAEKIALHAYKVTEADVDELRTHGLADEEILDLALTASARSFFSKTLDAMGCEPDEALAGTANLLDLVERSETQGRRP